MTKFNINKLGKKKWLLFGAILVVSGIIIASVFSFAGSCSLNDVRECRLVKNGSKGSTVVILQKQLNASCINTFYGSRKPLDADGDFGPKTLESVKAFQREFGLSADGIVGPKTWKKIYEINRYKNYSYTGVPTPPAPPK